MILWYNNTNNLYLQILEFHVEKSKLPFSILKITVWDNKKFAKDALLGIIISINKICD